MVNTKQALKRLKQSRVLRSRNKRYKTTMKTCVNNTDSLETFRIAQKHIDRAASKGAIKKNKSNRIKSRLLRSIVLMQPQSSV